MSPWKNPFLVVFKENHATTCVVYVSQNFKTTFNSV